jgi:serine/threonine protein kinase/Tfp pilus assembly protein PilF
MNRDPSSSRAGDADEAVARIVEEYVEQCRQGERPSLDDILQKHPQLAGELRDIFPMLQLMNQLGDPTASYPIAGTEATPSRDQIGEYKIIREAGRGGMGVVYEAQHAALDRRVALKMLPDHASSEKQKQRFYREARAAAQLHHTSIVPVFEVGEEDGTPFYAMQFIEGRGLDQLVTWAVEKEGSGSRSGSGETFWGDFGQVAFGSSGSNRNQGRWRFVADLGIQAAEALQYAHDHGIVHRDIKPSNLLLDDEHHLWITDFGLAKKTDDLDLTATGDIVGTLRYMAPEAIRGSSDHLSDIYSLGLVLYELAALQRPFKEIDRLDLMRQIGDTGPIRIGQLRRDVPVDLVTIIEKAIAREPQLRYATSRAFADDLQRFVNDQPIHARKVSLAGRWYRWARRNRALAAATSALLALLVLGFLGSSIAALRYFGMSRELQEALFDQEQATTRAEAVSKFMVDAFGRASPDVVGREVTVASVLDDAIIALDEPFNGDPIVKARLMESFGGTYRALGLDQEAETAYLTAYETLLAQVGEEDQQTVEVMWKLADARSALDPVSSLPGMEKAVARARTVCGENHPTTLVSEAHLALVYLEADRPDAAMKVVDHVLLSAKDASERVARAAAHATAYLVHAFLDVGDFDRAIEVGKQAVATATERFGPTSGVALQAMSALGIAYEDSGRAPDAVATLEQVFSLRLQSNGENHPATISTMSQLGLAHKSNGDSEKAISMLRQALEKSQLMLGANHLSTLRTMVHLAQTLTSAGRSEESIPLLRKVVAIRKLKLGENHSDTLGAQSKLAGALLNAGKYDEAKSNLEDSVVRMTEKLGAAAPRTLEARMGLGLTNKYLGRYDEALVQYEQVLKLFEVVQGPNGRHTLQTLLNIAACHRAYGNHEEALAKYKATYERAKVAFGPTHPLTTSSLRGIGILLVVAGDHDQAVQYCREAAESLSKKLGTDHGTVVTAEKHLAVALAAAGKFQQSRPMFEECIKKFRANGDVNGVVDVLDDFGMALLRERKFEESMTILSEALALQQEMPASPRKTTRTMCRLASVLARAGEVAEARKMLRTSIDIGKAESKTKTSLNDCFARLCEIEIADSRFETAGELLEEWETAFKERGRTKGVGSLDVCRAAFHLAQDEGPEALRIVEEILAVLAEADASYARFSGGKLVRAQALSIRGDVFASRGEHASAEEDLLAAHDYIVRWSQNRPDFDWLLRDSTDRIVSLYSDWGKEKQATEWREKGRMLSRE